MGDQGKYIIDIFYVWKRRFGSAWLYDQVLDFVFKDSGLVDGVLISSGWYQKGITERIYSRGLNIALNLFDSDDLKFCYQKVFNWLKSYHNDKIWGSSTSENYFDKRRRDLSIWEKIFYSGRVDKQEMFCILGKLPDEVKHSILFSTTNSEGDDNFLLRLLRDYQADKAGQLEVVETLGLDIWEFEDVNGNTAFSTFIVQSETFGLEVLYRIDTLERQEKEALIQEMVRRRDGSNIAPTEGQALLVVDKLLLKSFTHKKIRTSTWAHVCNREANLRISGASGENSGLYTEMINRFGKFDSKTKISLLEDLLKLYTDNCPAIIKCLDDAYSLSTNFEIKKAIDILAKCFPGRTASFNPIIELLPVDRRQEISQMLPGLYYQNSWQRYSLFFDCQERSNTGNSLSSQRQVSIERMAETLWSRTDGFSRDMEPSWIKNHRAFDSNTSSFLAQFLSQEDRHALRAVSKNPVDHDTQDDHDKISHTNDQALPPCN